MTNLLSRAAFALREAFKSDVQTARFLEKTHVDVRLNSRLWGV
jgi:hypothetical protein